MTGQQGEPVERDLNEVAYQLLWPRPSRDDLMYVAQTLSGGDYQSTGLFQRNSIGPRGAGRTVEACVRVTSLMWDADLVTLYEALLVSRRRPVPGKRAALKAQMYRLPIDHLTVLRNILVEQLVPLWSDVMGMQPTVVLDSGWGVHLHLAVEHEVGERVADLQVLYADLTRRINERVATRARELRPSLTVPCLFDRLTVGAQLARLPGTTNVKCEWTPRQVEVLELHPESALSGDELVRLEQGFGASVSLFEGMATSGPPRVAPSGVPPTSGAARATSPVGGEGGRRLHIPVPAREGRPVEVDFSEKWADGRTWADIAYALAPGERVKVKCPFGGNSIGSGFFARETDGRTRYYSHVLQQTFWDTVLRHQPAGSRVVRLVMKPVRRRGDMPKPVNSLQNLQLMMANDPDVNLWWDEFVGTAMDGDAELDEQWWLRVRLMMESKYNWLWSVPREVMMSTAIGIAKMQPEHRPRRWLERLASQWDGKKRLPVWMHKTFGVNKTDKLMTEYSLRWPIALVARMLEPGCKQDGMLILQGAQGLGKSTALEVWATQDDVQEGMFVDTRIRLDDKDALLTLANAWILEDAELLAHQGAGAEARKSFLSSRVDTYRRPYARRVTASKRHCVVTGSTNSTAFLSDVTGSRRYWVVRCKKVDLNWLRTYRDQLLGEAVNRYRDGEQWWLTKAASQLQAETNRMYLYATSYTAAAEALADIVKPHAVFTTEMFARVVGAQIRDHRQIRRGLEAAGWKPVRTSKYRGWGRVESTEESWDERRIVGRLAMRSLAKVWQEMFSVDT